MSSIFDKIMQATPNYGRPERVDSIESQQSSELVQRLKANSARIQLSLADKIKARRLSLAYKSEGIDKILDLTPLDQGELIIFCRKQSMLATKIDAIRQFRSPEEALEAMILATQKGYCRTCYEACTECVCSETHRDWV